MIFLSDRASEMDPSYPTKITAFLRHLTPSRKLQKNFDSTVESWTFLQPTYVRYTKQDEIINILSFYPVLKLTRNQH